MPLDISILILQRALPNLEQAHRHPRPNLRQLDAAMARPHKDVVSDFYTILYILEGYDAVAHGLCGRDFLPRREEVF